jgi:hypothetical protein
MGRNRIRNIKVIYRGFAGFAVNEADVGGGDVEAEGLLRFASSINLVTPSASASGSSSIATKPF